MVSAIGTEYTVLSTVFSTHMQGLQFNYELRCCLLLRQELVFASIGVGGVRRVTFVCLGPLFLFVLDIFLWLSGVR
jgi:hypothetical protein